MSISVNGHAISDTELEREAPMHGRGVAARSDAGRALVVRELLRAEAARRGLLAQEDPGPADEEEAIRELTELAVPVPEVTEAECWAFYEAEPDRFRGPDLFEPSHILFAAPPDSPEARASALTAARKTLAKLEQDPERFEQLARKHSGCPSGERGGSLGQLMRGETEPPFERHILELEVGQISSTPIETDHGFHIVRLDHRARGDRLPYSVVSDRIRIYLRDRAWRKALHAFIEGLARDARIEGIAI